ncbi:MAG: hypothetical protein LR001_10885 [Clostridiales bacterium]|nr:hypothetical protein [Clostridiales bacterium]
MYDYTICRHADEEIFVKQCIAMEKNISGIVKDKLLIDVDESKIQIYTLKGKEIIIHNSYYIDAVYVKSEIDLAPYFSEKTNKMK